MEVETEKNIELIYSNEIKRFSGLNEKLKALLKLEKCSSTALMQSCASSNCSVVLYYNKTYTGIHGDLDNLAGFITVLKVGNMAEIYNLCSAHPKITEALLNYVIQELRIPSLWIGILLKSPYFDENLKVFTELNFGYPVIPTDKKSPSGISLDYDYMAFIRPTRESAKETTDKSLALRNDFLNPKPKFRNLPRPTMNIKVSDRAKKSTSALKTPSPKSRSVAKSIVKAPHPKEKIEVSSFVRSPVWVPSPSPSPKRPEQKVEKKERVRIKSIKTNPKNPFTPIRRKDRNPEKEAYLQNVCLNDYVINGRLIDGHELLGVDAIAIEEKLREGGYIYEGAYGVVYKVCNIDNDCNYVMKVQRLGAFTKGKNDINLEPKVKSDLDDWTAEVNVTIEFNKYGVGAKLASAWLCENEFVKPDGSIKRDLLGIIVSEKWDGNMENQPCLSRELLDKLENQVNIIHKLGYVHMDIFPKNVLCKKNWFGTITDVTLTDFGWVRPIELVKNDKWILDTFFKYHVIDSPQFFRYYDGTITRSLPITKGKFYDNPRLMDFDQIYTWKYECGYM
jgi:hypothetical protein